MSEHDKPADEPQPKRGPGRPPNPEPEISRAARMLANDVRICPRCGVGGKRQVMGTRREVHGVHRRRKCSNCGWRWTGIEVDLMRIQVVLELERALAHALNTLRERHGEAVALPEIHVPDSPIPERTDVDLLGDDAAFGHSTRVGAAEGEIDLTADEGEGGIEESNNEERHAP